MEPRISTYLLTIAAALALAGVGLPSLAPAQERQAGPEQQERLAPIRRPFDRVPPVEIQEKMKRSSEAFRSAVASTMQDAAKQAGVAIRADNFMAIPLDDSGRIFVNTMVEKFDQLTIEDIARGADALFILSSVSLSAGGKEIDPGFYVVRILRDRTTGKWIAQFKNNEGRIVLEADADVEKADASAAKMQPMCTLGPRGELILFDEHDKFKNVFVEVKRKGGGNSINGQVTWTPASRALRQTMKEYVEHVARQDARVAEFVRRYTEFAPLSVAAWARNGFWKGDIGSGMNAGSMRQTITCKEIIKLQCVRLIECRDDEGHAWGIMLTNPDCAKMDPIFFH